MGTNRYGILITACLAIAVAVGAVKAEEADSQPTANRGTADVTPHRGRINLVKPLRSSRDVLISVSTACDVCLHCDENNNRDRALITYFFDGKPRTVDAHIINIAPSGRSMTLLVTGEGVDQVLSGRQFDGDRTASISLRLDELQEELELAVTEI